MDPTSPSLDAEVEAPDFEILDESDDEETIAQEESLEPEVDPQEELRLLANDLEISVEELTAQSQSNRSRRNRQKVDYKAMLEEQLKRKKENVVLQKQTLQAGMSSKCTPQMTSEEDTATTVCNEKGNNVGVSELAQLYLTNPFLNNDDEETDTDYKPMLKPNFNREIRVGPDFQAEIPDQCDEGRTAEEERRTAEENPQDNDVVMWEPSPCLTDSDIETYLCQVSSVMHGPSTEPLRRLSDSAKENALIFLQQCRYSVELALGILKQKAPRDMNGSCSCLESETNNEVENIENANNKNDIKPNNETNIDYYLTDANKEKIYESIIEKFLEKLVRNVNKN